MAAGAETAVVGRVRSVPDGCRGEVMRMRQNTPANTYGEKRYWESSCFLLEHACYPETLHIVASVRAPCPTRPLRGTDFLVHRQCAHSSP
eukprot:1660874-Prymnesium_polylepis.1